MTSVFFVSPAPTAPKHACGVSNPPFKAAMGLPRNSGSALLVKACAYVNPQFQAAHPYSNRDYPTNKSNDSVVILLDLFAEKSVSKSSTDNDQLEKPKHRALSVSTRHRPHSNFIKIVPVESEFRDLRSIPKSMADLPPADQMVNFYPVTRKGRNYLKYCIDWLSDDEKPSSITQCVRRYTSGPNWYCTEVNMALAADSPELLRYGPYIQELKYSIGRSLMNYYGTVFRGT